MTEINGKVAFVTGAASGIGYAIAKAMAARGARVMLSDLDADRLKTAEETLRAAGADVASFSCDVADEAQMRAAAQATLDAFGSVSIVVNNAGVGLGGAPGAIPLKDWRWIVDINLMGVVHGVEVFVPHIRAAGGGHIVNVASLAGHTSSPGMGPYHATKFAVVGYSEALKLDLAESGIGVSIVCPAWVRTSIHRSAFSKPSGGASESDPQFQAMNAIIEGGIDPDELGEWTSDCVEADRLYVFTHPAFSPALDLRYAQIKADYEAAAKHPPFLVKS